MHYDKTQASEDKQNPYNVQPFIPDLPHDEQEVRDISFRNLAFTQQVEVAGNWYGVNPHQDALVHGKGSDTPPLLGYLHDQLLIEFRLRGMAEGAIFRLGPHVGIIM